MTPRRKKALKRGSLVLFLVLLAGSCYKFDYLRQNIELFLLTATGRMWTLHGELRETHIQSAVLGDSRRTYVYTPPGYSAAGNTERYPVLYLLHGFPDFGDMGWIRYGRAPQIIDREIVAGHLPPMIIIAPNGEGVGALGDSEYLDAVNPATKRKHGAQMMTFISEELPHWVDAHYRTDGDPSHRWIGGVSTGAYGAMNIALQHPKQFGVVISLSGYYDADPSGYARPIWGYHPDPKQVAAESPVDYIKTYDRDRRHMFIYIGVGAEEKAIYKNEAKNFSNDLSSAGINHTVRALPGKHSWDLWRDQLLDAVTLCAKTTLVPKAEPVAAKAAPARPRSTAPFSFFKSH